MVILYDLCSSPDQETKNVGGLFESGIGNCQQRPGAKLRQTKPNLDIRTASGVSFSDLLARISPLVGIKCTTPNNISRIPAVGRNAAPLLKRNSTLQMIKKAMPTQAKGISLLATSPSNNDIEAAKGRSPYVNVCMSFHRLGGPCDGPQDDRVIIGARGHYGSIG